MKKTEIKKSMETLTPNDVKKQKIFLDVMKRQQRHVPRRHGRVAFAILGSVLILLIGARWLSMNNQNEIRDLIANEFGIETDIAIVSMFSWQGKTYVPLDRATANEWGVSKPVLESEIGEMLTTLENAGTLSGCEVYAYLPAQAQALVVLKKDSDYHLYQFMTFERYENNQDEDAIVYLELYGIHQPSDIITVEIGNETITDEQQIEIFYQYYKVLENSSDAYFEALFGSNSVSDLSRTVTKTASTSTKTSMSGPDTPVSSDGSVIEQGERSEGNEGSTSAYPGSASGLENAVPIRIHTKSGLIYETTYYPELGFISRFAVGEDFTEFLKQIG